MQERIFLVKISIHLIYCFFGLCKVFPKILRIEMWIFEPLWKKSQWAFWSRFCIGSRIYAFLPCLLLLLFVPLETNGEKGRCCIDRNYGQLSSCSSVLIFKKPNLQKIAQWQQRTWLRNKTTSRCNFIKVAFIKNEKNASQTPLTIASQTMTVPQAMMTTASQTKLCMLRLMWDPASTRKGLLNACKKKGEVCNRCSITGRSDV